MRGRLALLSIMAVLLLAPVTGTRSVAAEETSLEAAKTTAWQLSVLESQSDWNSLYDRMHPDAQLTVGRETVAYWYRTYFAVNGPNPATITGVTMVNWTWPVTGRMYPATAEVSFTQVFDNGSTVADVVRLVRASDGAWRWFFGRSPEFVQTTAQEAQESRDGRSIPERAGVPAATLFAESISAILRVPPTCFVAAGIDAVPDALGSSPVFRHHSESGAQSDSASYLKPDGSGFPDLVATVRTLNPGESPESFVQDLQKSQLNWDGPPYSAPPRGIVTDLAPDSPWLVAYYEESNEAVGFVPVLIWGPRGSNTILGVAGPAGGLMNELAAGWSQRARSTCAG